MSATKQTDYQAENQRLEAEIASLKAAPASRSTIRFSVGPKGTLCVHGLNGKYPVSLYWNQWERFLKGCDSGEVLTGLITFANKHLVEDYVVPTGQNKGENRGTLVTR